MSPEIRTVPLWRQRRVQIVGAVALAAVAVVAGIVVAGSGGEKAPVATKPTTTTAPATTTTVAPPTAPLTGLPDLSGVVLERAVLAVKIDNVHNGIRPPQAGLDVADVVYEEPVEGATRFLALFHSTTPERVGPVRSTRFIDPGIVWPLRGLYVYSGGTAPKVAAIREAPVRSIDETALVGMDARIRDSGIRAPHNLFAIPERIWAAAEDRTPPSPLFLYRAEGDHFAGEPVASVEIPSYSKAHYTWDAEAGRWLREALIDSSGSRKPHLAESGEQIAPVNLIVQKIGGTEATSVMVGEGDAWIFSEGRVVRGRWTRPGLEQRTAFVDDSGAEVELTPGITWVHLVASDEPVITAG